MGRSSQISTMSSYYSSRYYVERQSEYERDDPKGKAYRIGDEVLVNFGLANVGGQVFMGVLPDMLRGRVNAEDYSAFMIELRDEVEPKAVRKRTLLNGSFFGKKREFDSTVDEVVQRWSPRFDGALSWARRKSVYRQCCGYNIIFDLTKLKQPTQREAAPVEHRLQALATLRAQGLISEADYQQKHAFILQDL